MVISGGVLVPTNKRCEVRSSAMSVAPSPRAGQFLMSFTLPGIELIDSVRTGVANKKKTVVVHGDFGEVAKAGRWSDHVSDELVVSSPALWLQFAHASVRIESRILPAIAKVDEVGQGVAE